MVLVNVSLIPSLIPALANLNSKPALILTISLSSYPYPNSNTNYSQCGQIRAGVFPQQSLEIFPIHIHYPQKESCLKLQQG